MTAPLLPPTAGPLATLWHWLRQWWRVVHLGAVILVLALTPASYRQGVWPAVATQLVRSAGPMLAWFTLLMALFGLVLIRIVVVTAQSYGLSQYAVEMVVRVLVLELIPLAAGLFVALRLAIPLGSELLALREQGAFAAEQAAGRDPLRWLVLPRALAGICSVLLLVSVSGLVALLLAYVSLHGFTPWALESYTRQVGHVFHPAVSLIFVFKTVAFALAVALLPLASGLFDPADPGRRASAELQSLVRLSLVLLLIEAVSLLGNYY